MEQASQTSCSGETGNQKRTPRHFESKHWRHELPLHHVCQGSWRFCFWSKYLIIPLSWLQSGDEFCWNYDGKNIAVAGHSPCLSDLCLKSLEDTELSLHPGSNFPFSVATVRCQRKCIKNQKRLHQSRTYFWLLWSNQQLLVKDFMLTNKKCQDIIQPLLFWPSGGITVDPWIEMQSS